MFGSRGCTITRPSVCEFSKPIRVNVLPASVLLYIPSPYDVVWRLFASPVATYTMSGFDGARVMSAIEADPYVSNTGVNVVPLFTVLRIPLTANPM